MGARHPLVGRDDELAEMSAFLHERTDDALVLTGEAGLGKTQLWEAAVDVAAGAGARVLVATPGEGEGRYSFSVLTDLLRDVDLAGATLSPPQRRALEVVLMRAASDEPVDLQVVGVALESVLAGLAGTQHLVIGIDDVQWADLASLEALTFAARRLAGHGVQFLLTRRAGFDRTLLEGLLVRRRLRLVEPRALQVTEVAHLLVQELGLTTSPRVARLVHEQSRGNPLHALEIGRVLQRRGEPALGEPLGVPEELATVLGLRVRDLSEDHRQVLLALSVDPHLPETVLTRLVGVPAVEQAVRDRLVTMSASGRVRPSHPLLAAAARETVSPGLVRAMHDRLAELAPTEESRARHRALARPEPDEDLAETLSTAAAGAADRGAVQDAAELAELALERTPADSPARPARVIALAHRLAAAGEAGRLSARIEPEIASLPFGPERGSACLSILDGIVGSVANLEHWVQRALDECAADPGVTATALQTRAMVRLGIRVSGVDQALADAEAAAALGAEQGIGRDWYLVHTGREPETGNPHAWSKWHLWRGDLAETDAVIRKDLAQAEEQGRMRDVVENQLGLSEVAVRSGRLAEARELLAALDDALMPDKESKDEDLLRAAVAVLAGDAVTGEHWARRTAEWAAAFGHGWIELETTRLRGVAALLDGDPERAARHLRAAWDWVVRAGVTNPGTFPVTPDLVEALTSDARHDEATEVLAWLERHAVAQANPWGQASVDRGRALLGLATGDLSPAEAEALMVRAADRLADLGFRPDEARTCLAVGGALRRQRQWGAARAALERARDGFDRMGAEGWSELARAELAKVGGRQKRAADALTPAEETTARLAAEGLSNKQIARRTGVSVGTVEAHLGRAYLKLGVRSRTQLAARLPGVPEA
ncbi:AAA family ATPase [Nocardioides sp.]|uniref:helix-turn-helix transcriptional regulator n=1 Tax=Nocardioides sp. TaxID=35761 RepID=UPI001A2B804B|nr:AAA family ATPase [Nocardioides sp.]MBJ7356528.1 helix-turn-helix transcriptional regulator [Nocardioides sp.]